LNRRLKRGGEREKGKAREKERETARKREKNNDARKKKKKEKENSDILDFIPTGPANSVRTKMHTQKFQKM
jgi:hypothetical protein